MEYMVYNMEYMEMICKLVVWNMIFFFHILGRIIPTDELIFFTGVGIPPTSKVHRTPQFNMEPQI